MGWKDSSLGATFFILEVWKSLRFEEEKHCYHDVQNCIAIPALPPTLSPVTTRSNDTLFYTPLTEVRSVSSRVEETGHFVL